MKLGAKQLESLCEGLVEESARTGTPVRELVDRLCGHPEMKPLVTRAECMRAIADFKRDRRFEAAFGEEIAVDPETLVRRAYEEQGADDAAAGEARGEEILEVLRYLGGDLVRAKVVWRPAKCYTLRAGETAEYCKEKGDGWLICAVLIMRGGEVARVFPEMRIKARRRPGWNGTQGETLLMERMTLDCEELDREKIITRFAAAMQMHHSASGLKNAAHVARLTGRTRAAGAAMRATLVREYYKRTDGAAGFKGVSSSRRLKERAKKSPADGKKAKSRTSSSSSLPKPKTKSNHKPTAAPCHEK